MEEVLLMQRSGHEEIARRAYELYLCRGAGDGLALDDWLEAERQLSQLKKKQAAMNRPPSRRKPRP